MFIAMNRFQVNAGKEADFEEMWRSRETYLDQVPGFVAFALLKGSTPEQGGATEYVSHSTWRSRKDFDNWTNSDHFTRGHAQGSVAGVLAGPPVVALYESVLEQQAAKA
jgi:heme-degrading monooxygenase HmoA